MSDNIIQLNQELIYNELKDLVCNSVEETLNALLIMKQMNSLIPINMSVPVNVKDIVPDITAETFKPQLVRSN